MATFLVTRLRSGPAWDATRPMEQQSGWQQHAAFMDALVEDGFVVLGGPLEDEHRVVLVCEAGSVDEVHARLESDPWSGSHLETQSVEPWAIRLDGRPRG